MRLNAVPVDAEGINSHCKMMLLNIDYAQDRKKWEDACAKNFTFTPQFQKIENPFVIVLLQLKAVSEKEVSFLNE